MLTSVNWNEDNSTELKGALKYHQVHSASNQKHCSQPQTQGDRAEVGKHYPLSQASKVERSARILLLALPRSTVHVVPQP